MAEELKCQNCGKGFIPTCHITRQKFCSDVCRNRYHSAKGHYGVYPDEVVLPAQIECCE